MSCSKRRYFTRAEAEQAMAEIAPLQPPGRRVSRAYACWVCSARKRRPVWHLTSLGLRDDRRREAIG